MDPNEFKNIQFHMGQNVDNNSTDEKFSQDEKIYNNQQLKMNNNKPKIPMSYYFPQGHIQKGNLNLQQNENINFMKGQENQFDIRSNEGFNINSDNGSKQNIGYGMNYENPMNEKTMNNFNSYNNYYKGNEPYNMGLGNVNMSNIKNMNINIINNQIPIGTNPTDQINFLQNNLEEEFLNNFSKMNLIKKDSGSNTSNKSKKDLAYNYYFGGSTTDISSQVGNLEESHLTDNNPQHPKDMQNNSMNMNMNYNQNSTNNVSEIPNNYNPYYEQQKMQFYNNQHFMGNYNKNMNMNMNMNMGGVKSGGMNMNMNSPQYKFNNNYNNNNEKQNFKGKKQFNNNNNSNNFKQYNNKHNFKGNNQYTQNNQNSNYNNYNRNKNNDQQQSGENFSSPSKYNVSMNIQPSNLNENNNYIPGRYFVMKSLDEDNIHKSIKYRIWCSTTKGNQKLQKAFKEADNKYPIYLFFSVNGSGRFLGLAQMTSEVEYRANFNYWTQNEKWKGFFFLVWLTIKDIPNRAFKHLINEYNEDKPVTASRDTQEIHPNVGNEMLKIFSEYAYESSILDDFKFYEQKQDIVKTPQDINSTNTEDDFNNSQFNNNSVSKTSEENSFYKNSNVQKNILNEDKSSDGFYGSPNLNNMNNMNNMNSFYNKNMNNDQLSSLLAKTQKPTKRIIKRINSTENILNTKKDENVDRDEN